MGENIRTGAGRAVARLALSTTIALGVTCGVPCTTEAAVVVRFANGREIVVREYWYADRRLMFTYAGGTVGVAREFVAAVAAEADAMKAGGRHEGGAMRADAMRADAMRADEARAAGGRSIPPGRLSRRERFVRLPDAMPSKDELYDRAVDLVADGDLAGAIAAYQEAIALDAAFTDAIHGIAMAYADRGMFDEAIEWGKRLVELTPDDTLAHTSLSMFYQRKGMIAEAEAEGAKARVLDWKRQLAEEKEPK